MPGRPLTPTDLDRLATLDTMDIVGIEVWAHHGVFAQERQEGQPFRVDVTWWQDMRQASHTDDVAHAIDYAQVADLVVEVVKGSPVDLIETLAYRVQETLLARFPMDCVQICVHKPQAPLSASVTDVLVTTAPRTHTPPGSQGRAAADGLRPDQAARLSPNPPIHCCSAPPYGHPGPIATAQQTSSLPSRCRCAQCTHLVALATQAIGASRLSPPPPGRAPRWVVFSLGSNIEPRLDYLQFAVSVLVATPGVEHARVSPVYDTVAQGEIEQENFLNAVLIVQSGLPAPDLLHRALSIESRAHRTRQVAGGPRTLDIDLICAGAEVWSQPDLILPHPRAANRAFVLVPWLAVDPSATLAGTPVSLLAARVLDQETHRLDATLFVP